MHGSLKCLVYLVAIGALSFPLGRLLPKKWFSGQGGMMKCFSWEKGGKIYEKLGIKSWQGKLPDMSRIFPRLIPPRHMAGQDSALLQRMIEETGIAELTHVLLALAGLYCIRLWPGMGGAAMAGIFFLGNLPFILIQRYERPRLRRLLELRRRREARLA